MKIYLQVNVNRYLQVNGLALTCFCATEIPWFLWQVGVGDQQIHGMVFLSWKDLKGHPTPAPTVPGCPGIQGSPSCASPAQGGIDPSSLTPVCSLPIFEAIPCPVIPSLVIASLHHFCDPLEAALSSAQSFSVQVSSASLSML